MKEFWRPVVGWEGIYEVSNQGRVKRVKSGKGTRANRILSERISANSTSYPRVGLFDGSRKKDETIHTLVCAAFLGPRPKGKEINHKNGNKRDPRLVNLEYVTRRENVRHSIDVLGNGRGEKGSQARLTEKQVLQIRADRLVPCRECGRLPSYEMLAVKYGVHMQTIAGIIQGKTWAHVPLQPRVGR